MPPPELPGFYWDEAKNRYFPLTDRSRQPQSWQDASSSRAQTLQSIRETAKGQSKGTPVDTSPLKRRRTQFERFPTANFNPRTPVSFATQNLSKQSLLAKLISGSQGQCIYNGDSTCSSFEVFHDYNSAYAALWIGDTGGWLQSCRVNPQGTAYDASRELYLGSEVAAVCRSDAFRLAVSFGPACKIAVENLSAEAALWTILSLPDRKCHDVRVAHLEDRSLVLGAAGRGILLSDVENSFRFDTLTTGSDVFSIFQKDHSVYTGCRNGSIISFDKRLDTQQKGQELFSGKFRDGTRSITHLSVVREWQMVVSTILGDLELLDIRFASSTRPVLQLNDHVNTWATKLGVAVSPCHSFLFAAGQDAQVRSWSLLSGDPVLPPLRRTASPSESSTDQHFLLDQQFTDPVTSLQTIDDGSGELTLWAVTGREIYRYHI